MWESLCECVCHGCTGLSVCICHTCVCAPTQCVPRHRMSMQLPVSGLTGGDLNLGLFESKNKAPSLLLKWESVTLCIFCPTRYAKTMQ